MNTETPEVIKDNAVITSIIDGQANQEEMQKASRFIQINLASQLLSGTKQLIESLNPLYDLQQKVIDKLVEKITTEIDEMSVEDLTALVDTIQKRALATMELQRKIAQGRDLLSCLPALSDEEKGFLAIIKTLKNDDEKRAFVEALKGVKKVTHTSTAPTSVGDDEFPEE